MRILILSQYFFPEDFRINDLALELERRGHDVEVLTGMPNYPRGQFFKGYGVLKKWREVWNDIVVLRVPLWPRGKGGALNLICNYLSFIVSASILGLPRLRRRYDIIFIYGVSPILSALPALLYRAVTRTPTILWIQDLWPQSVFAVGAIKNRRALKVIEFVVRFIYRRSDLILMQSNGFRENVSLLAGPERELHYFPNWAEDVYRPIDRDAATVPVSDLPKGFRVMLAGNIGLAQSIPTILEAAKKLSKFPDIQWILLGDGAERSTMMAAAASAGLGNVVHFLGRFPMATMPHFFAQSDVMLVTLRSDPIFSVTVPGRVQSYLACGRPIVGGLDGEGQRLISESGAGFSGPAGDADALAENVLRLYHMNHQDREEMGRRGLEYYKTHFERGRSIDALEAHITRLVSLRRSHNNSSHDQSKSDEFSGR